MHHICVDWRLTISGTAIALHTILNYVNIYGERFQFDSYFARHEQLKLYGQAIDGRQTSYTGITLQRNSYEIRTIEIFKELEKYAVFRLSFEFLNRQVIFRELSFFICFTVECNVQLFMNSCVVYLGDSVRAPIRMRPCVIDV